MRTTLWVGVLFLVACKGGTGDDYPINPGGDDDGTGSSGSGSDAGSDAGGSDSAAGTMIPARACLLTDARNLRSCSDTGVAALTLTVTLGTTSLAITDDGGHFTIVQPTGSALIWKVEGAMVMTSYMLLDGESTLIPVITKAKFGDMESMALPIAVDTQGLGSIVAQLTTGGVGVTGATSTTPSAAFRQYDGATDIAWQNQMTGAAGAVWAAGVPAATAATLTVLTPAQHTRTGLPVHIGAITFTTITL